MINLREDDHFYIGETHFNLCNKTIEVYAAKEDFELDYAQKCTAHANQLSATMIEDLCHYTTKYCKGVCNLEDIQMPSIKENAEILKYVDAYCILIHKPKIKDQVGYSVVFHCHWDDEISMQWIIKENEVLYVGNFEDVTPWRHIAYYKNLNYNYVFNSMGC